MSLRIDFSVYMKKIILFFFSILSPLSSSYAQDGNNIILTGVVISSGSEHSIPFASLSIKTKGIGIVANDQGEFKFIITASALQDTLMVSSIGFKSFSKVISTISSQTIRIELQEIVTTLPEVVVRALQPMEILKRAIQHMDSHFDDKPYAMETFFRIAVRKDSNYVGLLDAAITMHDQGRLRNGNLSANLLQLRKIAYKDNWIPGSGISFRSPAVSIEQEFGRKIRTGILNFSKAKKFWDIELNDILYQDTSLYYVLKANPKRYDVYFPYYFATLKIRASDYAIMHIEYDYGNNLIEFSKQFPAAHPYGGMMNDKTLLHYHAMKGTISFIEYNHKLYLNREFYEEKARLSNAPLGIDVAYEGSFEIFVNKILHDVTSQSTKPISRNDDVFKLVDIYDSAFWSNYNKPIHTQLYQKAISNIEVNGDLKSQFQYFTSRRDDVRDYFLTRQIRTKHFVIQYDAGDSSVIKTIKNVLEENYDRVKNDLGALDMPIVTVKIYPTVKAYHHSIGDSEDNSEMIGSALGVDEFRIVSPLRPGPSHSYQSIMVAFIHEFTHCVHAAIAQTPSQRAWLWESIACHEARQFILPSNLDYIEKHNYPTLSQMNHSSENGYAYQLGYFIIEYIKITWSKRKLVDLLKNDGDIQSILHVSEKEFETGFYSFIENKYLKK